MIFEKPREPELLFGKSWKLLVKPTISVIGSRKMLVTPTIPTISMIIEKLREPVP